MGENVSSGRVLVFTKVADGWRHTAELKGSDPATDIFGRSLSVSCTTLVVGADAPKGVGRAYVFEKTATGWTQTGELEGSDTAAGDNFGAAVAVSGTTAVVGGASDHANNGGRAYVFTKTANGWRQVAELKGSSFGGLVAISGKTIVVGGA